MLQFLTLLVLGLGLPLALAFTGLASWSWIGLGAAAWVVAVVVKVFAGGLVWVVSERLLKSNYLKAAVWGMWSGICELGATAIAFGKADVLPGLGDAVGFGVAAGSVEVLYVLLVALTTSGKREMPPPTKSDDTFLAWSGVVERYLTSAMHLATRGLVWVGLHTWRLAPGIVLALAAFALVDGVATYGEAGKWNWGNPRIARRFYAFLAAVTAIAVVAFGASVLLL